MKPNGFGVFFAALVVVFVVGIGLFICISAKASSTDDRIEASARNSYVFKTYLKDDSISVDSREGDVKLTGTVSDDNHRILAQDTVSGLPGVKSVQNEIQVAGQHPEAYSDGWLGFKVKSALLFHRNVSAVKTQVDVKDGVITLSGEADGQAQKDLTSEYARDVDGVKEVKNEMTIAQTPAVPDKTFSERVDDASITAQIKMALLARRSTSAVNTKVSTDNGIVTLTGKAKNAAEKDLVTELVKDINGVTSVVNNMEVIP